MRKIRRVAHQPDDDDDHDDNTHDDNASRPRADDANYAVNADDDEHSGDLLEVLGQRRLGLV
jgi:hypothetical protein